MKKYSDEKEKIISQWDDPRSWNETYKNHNYTEYTFIRVNKGIHCKSIWVYEDLIFNRKKDMIAYIERTDINEKRNEIFLDL